MYRRTPCAALVMLAVLAGMLVGCGTTRVAWTKPGANDEMLQRDLQQCAIQANSMTPSYFDRRTMSVVSDPQETERLQHSCMIGRGWQLTPQP